MTQDEIRSMEAGQATPVSIIQSCADFAYDLGNMFSCERVDAVRMDREWIINYMLEMFGMNPVSEVEDAFVKGIRETLLK